ncbi:MAG TPA: class I SAM-dependent methyltransferase [Verrucomicrobiae bacterium]
MPHLIYLLALCLCANLSFAQEKEKVTLESGRYEQRHRAGFDGTGRYYMGREIAHVMGHQAADWLERPEREQEEHTTEMIKLLDLKPGEKAADIGAGTGYITRRLAEGVGKSGSVYGVEIQQEMLDLLQKNMRERGHTNIISVLGTVSDPKLPANTLDLIIMVDVYHEFSHPYEMMDNMVKALKPGGRIAFVEFKAEDQSVPIKRTHKMSEAQVKKEALVFKDLEWSKTHTTLPWQHVIVFKKKAATPVKDR